MCLHYNQLNVILKEIEQLQKLKRIYLYDNQLNNIPKK